MHAHTQIKIQATSPIFETAQNARLSCLRQHPFPFSFFCLCHTWHERYFCNCKSCSVLMMELKKLSLDGSSQPEKKLECCYKRITHLGQFLLPICFSKMFCYKSCFDLGEVKCPLLPRRNDTVYKSPLCPLLLKSLILWNKKINLY